jgi:Tfp pilus assembly protein PilN
MRAVNLVPPESRAGRVSGGKSGGAVYGLLGLLVVMLLMLSSLAIIKRDKTKAEQEYAGIQTAAQAYEQVATQFASFETAGKQANERIELVRSLAQARFDWAGTLRDMARLIPRDAQIQTLDANVKDGVAGGGGSTFRSQIATVPAISLKGCSQSQGSVADLVTRLQAMRRVTNVTLEQSESDSDLGEFDKRLVPLGEETTDANSDGGTASGSSGGAPTDCSLPKPFYAFTVTVFYAPGKAQASAEAGSGSATAAAAPAAAAGIPSESAAATTPATPTAAGN